MDDIPDKFWIPCRFWRDGYDLKGRYWLGAMPYVRRNGLFGPKWERQPFVRFDGIVSRDEIVLKLTAAGKDVMTSRQGQFEMPAKLSRRRILKELELA